MFPRSSILALVLAALANTAKVLAFPVQVDDTPTTTINPSCPVTYITSTVETLSIIAPTTTGPFETTTIIETIVSYPLATETITQVLTFSGTIDVGYPTYTPEFTEYTTTITETYTYTNFFDDPPWPSNC